MSDSQLPGGTEEGRQNNQPNPNQAPPFPGSAAPVVPAAPAASTPEVDAPATQAYPTEVITPAAQQSAPGNPFTAPAQPAPAAQTPAPSAAFAPAAPVAAPQPSATQPPLNQARAPFGQAPAAPSNSVHPPQASASQQPSAPQRPVAPQQPVAPQNAQQTAAYPAQPFVAPGAGAPNAAAAAPTENFGAVGFGQSPTAHIPSAAHQGAPSTAVPSAAFPSAQSATNAFGVPAANPGQQPFGAGSSAAFPADSRAAKRADGSPKKRGGLFLAAAIAVGALVGGASGAGVTALAMNQASSNGTQIDAENAGVTVNNPDAATLATVVASKASPSTVTLSVSNSEVGSSGSGVILDKEGHILTNAHVVSLPGSEAPTIQVTSNDGRIFAAELVAADPVNDLAVVKLKNPSKLTPIDWGSSSKLNVGDAVVAIGAPLGLPGTVTTGVVSALNRSITVASSEAPQDEEPAPDGEEPFDFWNFGSPEGGDSQAPASTSVSLRVIQTDAAINPGNSGGALLNAQGELIGINVAIYSTASEGEQAGSIGVGFAIPSDVAKRVADELIENGEATHGLLGATVIDTASVEELASVIAGALIQDVASGSAADDAGLSAGDVVTGFDGTPITGSTDLTAAVRSMPAGAEVTLTVWRDGKTSEIDVTLGGLGS